MIDAQQQDTICAIATGGGEGAIAVIRLSGEKAFAICDDLVKKKGVGEKAANSIHFNHIVDGNELIDEVLISVFKAPQSYTGQNIVEISCHGSSYIQQKIQELAVKHGARLAEKGEFTLRAFLNNKMDLSQAEAVADLIASGSEASHKTATSQLRGHFSNDLQLLRQQLMDFASLIELELDFSEEDVEFAERDKLLNLVSDVSHKVTQLVDSFAVGNAIKNGIPVVIAGHPNVGKSTLLNALLNEDRAIVSNIAGTTRDVIEDELVIEGIKFRFIDTAGLRKTVDTIEAIGVNKTLEKIKDAAIILYLFDVHEISSRELSLQIENIKRDAHNKDAKLILVGNKIDKENLAQLNKEFKAFENVVLISAREKTNIDGLLHQLAETVLLRKINYENSIVTNARHWEALTKVQESLHKVQQDIENGTSGDFLAMDIRQTLHYLGEITGEVTTDDLLGNIFGKFCIGK